MGTYTFDDDRLEMLRRIAERIARRRVGDKDIAEDVAQQAMLELTVKFLAGKAIVRKPEALVTVIADRRAKDYLRSRGARTGRMTSLEVLRESGMDLDTYPQIELDETRRQRALSNYVAEILNAALARDEASEIKEHIVAKLKGTVPCVSRKSTACRLGISPATLSRRINDAIQSLAANAASDISIEDLEYVVEFLGEDPRSRRQSSVA